MLTDRGGVLPRTVVRPHEVENDFLSLVLWGIHQGKAAIAIISYAE